MNELIQQLTNRTGISEAQAQQALTIVLEYARQRLPPQLATQLQGVLSGDIATGVSDMAQEHINKLGGMFGNRE